MIKIFILFFTFAYFPLISTTTFCTISTDVKIAKLLCYDNYTIERVTEEKYIPEGCSMIINCSFSYEERTNRSLQTTFQFTCKKGNWFPSQPNCRKCGMKGKDIPIVYGGFINHHSRQTANYFDNPWNVAIYKSEKLICGGTIITERIIITAAHSFYHYSDDANISKLRVAVGKFTRDFHKKKDNKFTQFFEVKEIIKSCYGYYDSDTDYGSDIALLVLKDVIHLNDAVIPACIDWSTVWFNPPENTTGTVVGWGLNQGKQSPHLLTNSMIFVNNSKCVNEIVKDLKNSIKFDKFCAVDVHTDKGIHIDIGDSGAGFTVLDPVTSLHYIRGVVSVHIGETKYYSFTDISKYMGWIREMIMEVQSQHLQKAKNCFISVEDGYTNSSLSCNGTNMEMRNEIPDSCTLETECQEGYTFKNRGPKHVASVCQDGVWIPSIPQCLKNCLTPELVNKTYTCFKENSLINCDSTTLPFGTRIIAQCDVNFYPNPAANLYAECIEDGKWSNSLFECIPIDATCGPANHSRDSNNHFILYEFLLCAAKLVVKFFLLVFAAYVGTQIPNFMGAEPTRRTIFKDSILLHSPGDNL